MQHIPRFYSNLDKISLMNFKQHFEAEASHDLDVVPDGEYEGKQSGSWVLFLYNKQMFAGVNRLYGIRGCGNVTFKVCKNELIFS